MQSIYNPFDIIFFFAYGLSQRYYFFLPGSPIWTMNMFLKISAVTGNHCLLRIIIARGYSLMIQKSLTQRLSSLPRNQKSNFIRVNLALFIIDKLNNMLFNLYVCYWMKRRRVVDLHIKDTTIGWVKKKNSSVNMCKLFKPWIIEDAQ